MDIRYLKFIYYISRTKGVKNTIIFQWHLFKL